jgi:putative salt-induced outer membrane protein YdiY
VNRIAHAVTLRIFLIAIAATPARADEVTLENGDRFTGTVISLAGAVLTLATPYGNVRIPWPEVTRVAIEDPMLATLAELLARPQPPVTIDGGANAGIVTTAGNTEVNNLRLDGDVAARAGVNRYSASAVVTRAEDRAVETARNWTTAFKYDRFVSARMFLNGNAILTSDRFRDLDLRTALGAGVGYQPVTTPRVTLTADAGLGWVDENLESAPDDGYTALRESVSFDAFAVPDRIQIFHLHDGYFGVTGDDNLFVRMQNGIRMSLAAGFVATLRHDVDYDRSPAIGRRNTDRTLALTLGYRF